MKKAKVSGSMIVIVAIIAIALFMSPQGKDFLGGLGTTIDDGGAPSDDGVTQYQKIGGTATLYLDAYTGSWGGASTKTEVTPAYTIQDSTGQVMVSDAVANDTKTYVGETVDIYGTGASYYFDPVIGFEINNAAPRKEIQVYTIPSTANMDITVYDETGSNELTADDHGSNTADYAGGSLGASETYPYYIKFETKVADKTFRLGAICTYYCGDNVDDFTLEESGWTEVSIPNGAMTDTFTFADDTAATTTCSYKRCYVPAGNYIALDEWDDVKYQFVIDTDDTTGPSANGDSYVGATFLDYGCEVDGAGAVICDWYKHNADNDPGAVGLDENPETQDGGNNGLDVGVCIEPQ